MSRSGPPSLRRMVAPALFVGALFAVYLFRPDPYEVERELAFSGSTMGTFFNVKVVAGDLSDENRDRLLALAREVVDGVDHTMSTYKPDSEVVAFNHTGTKPFEASPELVEVVVEAQRVARLSDGAFDITVAPLVDLWGFGPAEATRPPSEDQVSRLLAATGYEQLEVDREGLTLRKMRPDIRIDLSAIAKGFAADRLSDALASEGLIDHMVEVGGEVRARGFNGHAETWRIGIEQPIAEGRALHTAVALADASLATSGDYRNAFEHDGVRYSHTIDPRTGRPVTHDLASVSVIHASCMTADALATALEVLGPDEGWDLAERHGIAALFLVRTGHDTFEPRPTRAWSALTENPATSPVVEEVG